MTGKQELIITPDKLIKAAEEWRIETESLEAEFAGVRAVAVGTAGYWQGEGGERCRQGIKTDTESAASLLQLFKGKPQMMLEMASIYQKSEAENKAWAGKLRTDFLR